MKKGIYIFIFLIGFVLTGCTPASFESNFNRYFLDVLNNQNEVKKSSDIYVDDFYGYNNITPNQIMQMPDDGYIVFYHNKGKNLIEGKFKEIIEAYVKSDDSLPVYLVDIEKYNLKEQIKLEFITREKNNYKVEKEWVFCSDVKLPYKVKYEK